MLLVQVHEFRTYTKYVLEILRKCGKSIETKSQKVLVAHSSVCKSYRRKNGGELFSTPPS